MDLNSNVSISLSLIVSQMQIRLWVNLLSNQLDQLEARREARLQLDQSKDLINRTLTNSEDC